MKTMLILSGISGSGKTMLAEAIRTLAGGAKVKICCADDYFYNKKGEYVFDPNQLGEAHSFCEEMAENACKGGVKMVIIANTNTTDKEMQPYKKIAQENGYICHNVMVRKDHLGENTHNVPPEIVIRQAERLGNTFDPLV